MTPSLYESALYCFFFFNDTATTEIYTLSLHDALPIFIRRPGGGCRRGIAVGIGDAGDAGRDAGEVIGVRARDALAVDDIHPRAIGAERDVMRLVGGRNQGDDGVRVLAHHRADGHGVRAAVVGIER